MADDLLRPDVTIRYTELSDAGPLKKWLLEPGVLQWFPMHDKVEVEDAVRHWIGMSKYRCSLTAEVNGVACGISTLYLMPYRKLAHQCLFSIIVDGDYRGQGIGTVLLNNIIHLGKTNFKLEVLYLEVYDGNPAIHLYRKFGFEEVGKQNYFIKEDGKYTAKITMERML